jgi:hypothetical protein
LQRVHDGPHGDFEDGIAMPVVADRRREHLPARDLFLQRGHRRDEPPSAERIECAAGRQRRVPAERVAGDREDLVSLAQVLDVRERAEVDQLRGVLSVEVHAGPELLGAIDLRQRRAVLRTAPVVAGSKRVRDGARSQRAADEAELVLAVGAASGAEQDRGGLRHRTFSSQMDNAACSMSDSETSTRFAAAASGT